MKGTEKIIAHIQAEAKAQADAILAKSELQCSEIRQSYEAKAKDAYGEKIRQGVKVCQDDLDSVERINQMEAKKALLALKQEMVSKSFEMAVGLLTELPQDKYIELLAKLAAKAAVTGDEEIVLNAKDKAAVGSAVVEKANSLIPGGKLSLAETAGDFAGGLILKRGSIEANCSIELLVELCRGEMSAQLAKLLFE